MPDPSRLNWAVVERPFRFLARQVRFLRLIRVYGQVHQLIGKVESGVRGYAATIASLKDVIGLLSRQISTALLVITPPATQVFERAIQSLRSLQMVWPEQQIAIASRDSDSLHSGQRLLAPNLRRTF